MSSTRTLASSNFERGTQDLLCANLADPVLAGAARGRSPVAAGLSAGHLANPVPTSVVRSYIPTAAGLSIGHAPLRAAHGRGPVAAGLSARHRPLRATHGRGPATVAELQWTCGPDSSANNQRQEHAVKSRLGNLHLRLSPTE